MGTVILENITKTYDDQVVVNQVDFAINEGEFFTFLGPSGCGKTTILRMIAGFVNPDAGKIYLGDRDITKVSPEKRSVGMVFQNYALFPHMNVSENIEYGLKVKRLSKREIQSKVDHYLHLVSLDGYGKRKVSELSGGEQQRVALARSLVMEPKVLLMDEPLSNLDARLRDKMRIEIRALQKELGITTIFVTHDQTEALTMSDRIAVFNKGACVQIGTPREVYAKPENTFVATFVGETNLFRVERTGQMALLNEQFEIEVDPNVVGSFLSIRPQDIQLYGEPLDRVNEFKGIIENIQYNGAIVEYEVNVGGTGFKVSDLNTFSPGGTFAIGDTAFICLREGAIRVLDR